MHSGVPEMANESAANLPCHLAMFPACSIITTWHRQWELLLAQLAPEENG